MKKSTFDLDSEIAVSVTNLKKNYKRNEALKGITLQLQANEIIGLIGANGSGKTTFFQIINGLLEASAGEFQVLGGNPLTDICVKNEMMYSIPDLPVGENEKVKTVLQDYALMFPHFDEEFAKKMLVLFEIDSKKRIRNLSKGMVSLFHFTCAMATRSKVTMLDEPFVGIDIAKRKKAYEILLRDYMEHPRTFIISSHNLAELENLLSQMVLIHKGALVFYEDMDTVKEMLYRVDGTKEEILEYTKRYEAIYLSHGETGSFAICKGSLSCPEAQAAVEAQLAVSPVSPEDVCVYITNQEREGELECLWN